MWKPIELVFFFSGKKMDRNHIEDYFHETATICKHINTKIINSLVEELIELRIRKGRLFVLGVGGSAANASHFCNDLRKLCSIESYAPSDAISELTARTNDDGWDTVFQKYLEISNLKKEDALLILSISGGAKGHSENLVNAIDYGKEVGSKVFCIVGRPNGYAAKKSDLCINIPRINANHIFAHSESFQSIILHALVTHPYLKTSDYL